MKNLKQIIEYAQSLSDENHDDFIESYFLDNFELTTNFILQEISIDDLKIENIENHQINLSKQKKYNQMALIDQPPIIINHDYTIIDGHHRVRACLKNNKKYIQAYYPI